MLCGIDIVLLLSHGGDFELNCSTPRQRQGGRDAQQFFYFAIVHVLGAAAIRCRIRATSSSTRL
jgi:hypothetical protein